MFIPVILGVAREGRQTEKAAQFVLEQAKQYGLETELLDCRDYVCQNAGAENTKKLSEKITKADGLIVVAPEYNHGYPGELKIMLDLVYKEYFKKPIGICGVSSGPFGGARMIEQLRLVAIEFHMVPIREALLLGNIKDLFDEAGNAKNNDIFQFVKLFFDELIWYAKILKQGRESL